MWTETNKWESGRWGHSLATVWIRGASEPATQEFERRTVQSRAVPLMSKLAWLLWRSCAGTAKRARTKVWRSGIKDIIWVSAFFLLLLCLFSFFFFCFVLTCQRKGLGSGSAPRMTSRVLIEIFLQASRAKLSAFIAFAERRNERVKSQLHSKGL